VITEEKYVMTSDRPGRATRAFGPDGNPLTLENLPPLETKRWVPRRKAELVAAVRGNLLSKEYVCTRYRISEEEFLTWAKAIERHGVRGLRTTRAQLYRRK
jgi:Protein of unknown function (DUF1153)